MKYPLILLLVILLSHNANAQKMIKAKNAYKYIGKKVTVCDTVYGAINSDWAQLFQINLGADEDYKRVIINIKPSVRYGLKRKLNKQICVTGVIEGTKQYPIINVQDTLQFN